ncbi:hypothetical protein FO519_003965 [Halicephalobus sp. NKZ332]|nr:hypothetical protein FO519_003965 [Halicephalobus sp. NKZ332]
MKLDIVRSAKLRLPSFLFVVRRSFPVCTALVDSSQEVRTAIAQLYSPSRKSSRLEYLDNVEQEEKKSYPETCGNDDYYSSGAEVMSDFPQKERALCPFETEVNIDSQRIPREITYVRCLCNLPKSGKQGENSGNIICEQVFFEMTVLKFDQSCKEFKEVKEKFVLACIPVFKSSRITDPNTINEKPSDGDIIQ